MKKNIISSLIAVLASCCVFAQELPRIIPPAPEATSVFKFSEVPISTYTGLPNISIPIYEIKCKGLTLPIHLGYHARGIQVAEIAPRVGLGWALSYGGMISRQVRDKADDGPDGYLTQNYYNSVFIPDPSRPNGFNSQLASMLNNYIDGTIDMVPDQFMFNANGKSGEFIFNQVTKTLLLQEYKDISIEKITNGDGIVGWKLTDENGNKFYYGKSRDGSRTAFDYDETINTFTYTFPGTMAQFPPPTDAPTISTWHLMEIETAFNESVSFYYEEEVADHYRHSFDATPGTPVVVSHFSHVKAHQKQLTKIEFKGGEIVLTPSASVRQDLTDAHTLEKISVYNNNGNSPDATLIKKYEFSYEYTTSLNDGNQLAYLKDVDPKSSKRLFLKSVQEKGRSDEAMPPYGFEYNSTVLPNRFSTSQDAWGYYNGANNGPYLTFMNYSTFNIDRTVDQLKSGAGLLTKVTYPTGGSVDLTYEQNVATRPSIMSSTIHSTLISSQSVPTGVTMLKNVDYRVSPGVYQKQFTIAPTKTGNILFEMDLPMCPDPIIAEECMYSVWLINSEGLSTPLYPRQNGERTWSFSVAPGTYTIRVEAHASAADDGSLFVVKLDWNETHTDTTYPQGVIPGPGKRIKKIEYKTDATTVAKEYEYLRSDGQTSGVLFGLPPFYSIWKTIEGINILSPYGCIPGSPLSTYQGNSIGYTQVTEYNGTKNNNNGKTEYVFTTTPDAGEYFSFPFHLPIDNEWLRGKNLQTRFFERDGTGTYRIKKLTTNSYRATTGFGPAELIHIDSADVDMEFEEPDPAGITSLITKTDFRIPLLVFNLPMGDELPSYKLYYQTGGLCDLVSTRETTFDGLDFITLDKISNYLYDYDNHYQLRGVETIASDNTKEISINTFPFDYPKNLPGNLTVIDTMRLKNLAAYPIEEVKYQQRNGSYYVLSGKLNTYYGTDPAKLKEVLLLENNKPIPLSSFRFSHRQTGELPLTGAPSSYNPFEGYKTKLKYDRYDSQGNILQYTIQDNTTTSYIWGYDHTVPVAELKNVTYDEAVAIVGQTFIDELNNTPVTDERVRLILEPLYSHPSMKDAMVTIYTYDPMRGVTSITDPNHVTTYYKYDNLGRLKNIKDKDLNLLKTIRYNYQTAE